MKTNGLLIVTCVIALLANSDVQAERVGYSLTGFLSVTDSPTRTWFGEPLETPVPVTATFTYDTTVGGNLSNSTYGEERIYRQFIAGGFTFDAKFDSKHVVVEASDYDIKVRNNFSSDNPEEAPQDMFLVSYSYNSSRQRVTVNGTEWTGPVAYMVLQLNWADLFPSETTLVADRPLADGHGTLAFTGSQGLASIVNPIQCCSAMIPQGGDYNYDGRINLNDYLEWRKAFGHTEPQYLYADGNHDGTVDGGDYMVWRKATAGGHFGLTAIPEPGCLTAVAWWLISFAWSRKRWQRGAR